MICDEKWIICDNRKRSGQWLDKDEPFSKAKVILNKVMAIVWCHPPQVLQNRLNDYSREVLMKLIENYEKEPALVSRRALLLHDNVRTHVSQISR